MKKILIILSPNATVTANNFNILFEAAKKKGIETLVVKSYKDAMKKGNKQDLYITSNTGDILKLVLIGRRNILYWVQGIVPEESYMRHKSRIRFLLLSWMEKYSLKEAKFLAFVSEPMKEHYEYKYKLCFSDKYYIFPCFNTEMSPTSFESSNKYLNNYFVYAGGLAVWQCFEKTLDIYKKIEDWGLPNTKLIVLTKEQQQAKEMIEDRNIRYFETGYTTPEELPRILKDAKFGFVIRENSLVNRVATPTKISTYLSCGLIPIFGNSIETFRRLSEKMNYTVCWDDTDESYDKIRYFMTHMISPSAIQKEYKTFFDNNYSRERHVENLGNIIKKMTQE